MNKTIKVGDIVEIPSGAIWLIVEGENKGAFYFAVLYRAVATSRRSFAYASHYISAYWLKRYATILA